MKEGSYSQRFDFGDMAEPYREVIDSLEKGTPSPSQPTEQHHSFQSQPKGEQEAHRERVHQKRTGMTPEEQEQRRKKQAEENRYREILFAFRSRPLTADEWELLESKPCSNQFNEIMKKLSIEERIKYGDIPKDIQKGLRQRATDYFMESLKDRYPSWWEVYDENGNRIWKMSPAHKASLAEMRRFNNLSPQEKLEWLSQFRENSQRYLRSAGFENKSPGEKFEKFVDGFIEFLLALFEDRKTTTNPHSNPPDPSLFDTRM